MNRKTGPQTPTLLELQRAIGQSMLHRLDGDVSAYVVADGLDGSARLGIYRNTRASALATALTLSFPAVRHLVGPEFFEGAVLLFVDEAPPHGALLDEYGAGFPEFLAQLPQAASLSYLADVARLEWQVNIVLHAPDVPPLDVARLEQRHETELAQWRFAPHPAVKLVRCDFPADAIWHAVLARDDSAMAAIDLADAPAWLLLQRTERGVVMMRLSECQWRFTALLFSGCPLHTALEEAPCADAQAVLAAHLTRGCFMDIGLTETASKLSFRRIRS